MPKIYKGPVINGLHYMRMEPRDTQKAVFKENITLPFLAKQLSYRTNLSAGQCKLIIEHFVDIIKDNLYQKNRISLSRFGVFFLYQKQPRLFRVRNVQTKQIETFFRDIHYVPRFDCSPVFLKQIAKLRIKPDDSIGSTDNLVDEEDGECIQE